MAYEKKVIKELRRRLGEINYHQWIEFFDSHGKGWAEPEAFLLGESEIILFEVKLTGGPHGKSQMELLYKPLLEAIYERPVRCLLICKWATDETPGPFVQSLEEFLAGGAAFATWHWMK